MEQPDPAPMVATTYDALAAGYDAWAGEISPPLSSQYLDRALSVLPEGASVLELGSGTGLPIAARLVTHGPYLGVDISPGMIEMARRNVPGAAFRQGDMRTTELPEAPFDAVLALYSIIHVPREDHAAVFARVHSVLRPGGWFIASFGAGDEPAGTDPNWLDAGPMFWSNHDAETTQRLISEAGLEIVAAEVHLQQEPEGEYLFLWVVCRRPT